VRVGTGVSWMVAGSRVAVGLDGRMVSGIVVVGRKGAVTAVLADRVTGGNSVVIGGAVGVAAAAAALTAMDIPNAEQVGESSTP
jgi:hypothetical protein